MAEQQAAGGGLEDMQMLTSVYPFNLAKDIFDNGEEAIKIYLPGIEASLATLEEREAGILRRRYSDKMTLKAIGKIYGVGQERIRQIKAKALRKLRHPTRASLFKSVPISELQEQSKKYHKLMQEYELLNKAFEMFSGKQAEPGVVIPLAELVVIMQIPIDELNFSTRTRNALARAGKKTLRDITEMTEGELSRIRNMGRTSAEEVKSRLEDYGLALRGSRCQSDHGS